MSEKYLPFFRKYRPQAFCDLIGQESLVKALSNAIELSRFANAYLFCGPRGTGKTSSARILAKSLNCVNGPTVLPCQKCPSCVDITNVSGLDVIEIDAATNRGIDDAKELISQVQYAPINGKYKIFIIDEVHMLSKEAFNALLKTFEEPPENVIFILATTEPHKVIETIVSRCQRFDFRRITVEDIVIKLKAVAKLEKIKITNDALFTIAKNVSGGMRDSLALLDQVAILGAKDEITKDLIDTLIGKITFEPMFNLLEIILSGNIEAALGAIEEIYSKGNEPRNFVENFIEFLRNFTIVINSNNPNTVVKFTSLNSTDVEKIIKDKANYNQNLLLQILNKAIEFYKEIRSSANPYLWTELMIIEMCGLKNSSSQQPVVQEIAPVAVNKIIKSEQKTEKKSKPISETVEVVDVKVESPENSASETSEETVPLNIENVHTDDIWPRIIAAIKSPFVMPFFRDVPQSVNIDDSSITIGFVHPNALIQAKSDSKFNALKEAMESVLEKKYEITFIQVPKGEKNQAMINAQNTQLQSVAPKKQADDQHYEIYSEMPSDIDYTDNTDMETDNGDEQIEKCYSYKTKLMLETFSGKVVD